MCGITGIMAFNEVGRMHMIHLVNSTSMLEKRGPDHQGTIVDDKVGMGHRRLAILDTSYNGNQPMKDPSGRYTIVFNGEIYNYRALREQLITEGYNFQSGTDTEVLLYMFMKEGVACLDKLNGFFAFAVYDRDEQEITVVRDRFGIKPLLYFFDEDKFLFASDMQSLKAYNFKKELDNNSLYQYLQYNYIPAPYSIFQNVRKLEPGHYLKIKKKSLQKEMYYDLKAHVKPNTDITYEEAKEELRRLLTSSVQQRLISDVPLGGFLSGGIDSSIITALAAKYAQKFETYSIGYSDNEFFDETKYAKKVAAKHGTTHHVYSLSNQEIFNSVPEVLDSLDEPFADSSCIPMYMLSQRTAKTKKVALSGDGADEIFAGYNKYRADFRIRNPRLQENIIGKMHSVWESLPKSRNDKFSNTVRQLEKFSDGMSRTNEERYFKWCKILTEADALSLLAPTTREAFNAVESESRRGELLTYLGQIDSVNDILLSDVNLVLQNDMLRKVDAMSMAHGLEVRVPFLEHNLVEFAFSLPESFKVDHQSGKKILRDAFKKELPVEVLNRKKKGFEVPLLDCLRTDLKSLVFDDLLLDSFIQEQGIFDLLSVKQLKQKLLSSDPGDAPATVWAIVVFQHWWKKNLA